MKVLTGLNVLTQIAWGAVSGAVASEQVFHLHIEPPLSMEASILMLYN